MRSAFPCYSGLKDTAWIELRRWRTVVSQPEYFNSRDRRVSETMSRLAVDYRTLPSAIAMTSTGLEATKRFWEELLKQKNNNIYLIWIIFQC